VPLLQKIGVFEVSLSLSLHMYLLCVLFPQTRILFFTSDSSLKHFAPFRSILLTNSCELTLRFS
jgi:hypothetical protein